MELARSEPDIGKRQMFPLSSQNTLRGWQSLMHSPKLAANFRAEFNPSGSEGDLDRSPCVSADDIGTNKQESVNRKFTKDTNGDELSLLFQLRAWSLQFFFRLLHFTARLQQIVLLPLPLRSTLSSQFSVLLLLFGASGTIRMRRSWGQGGKDTDQLPLVSPLLSMVS